jgi:4a-hydroxytetrahydrobiopterin dehydratase
MLDRRGPRRDLPLERVFGGDWRNELPDNNWGSRSGGKSMAKLNHDEIAARLKTLSGWEYRDNAISKLFRFKEFMDGIRFINQVASIAENADHHPDIIINYTRITFTCSTHSEGGVTEKDIRLASEIEQAFANYPGRA